MPTNSTTPPSQKDLFCAQTGSTESLVEVVFHLHKIPAPRNQKSIKPGAKRTVNFHIPSFKNAKRWITKLPNGQPLKRPFLITSPEFQKWMKQAVLSLESQLFSMFQTGPGATQPERSKLCVMLSLLPADDSVNDLTEGSWKINRVAPGEEGATITIKRLS